MLIKSKMFILFRRKLFLILTQMIYIIQFNLISTNFLEKVDNLILCSW